jgi:hypothetical protein
MSSGDLVWLWLEAINRALARPCSHRFAPPSSGEPVRPLQQRATAERSAVCNRGVDRARKFAASGYRLPPPGDESDALRPDMLGVNFAGGYRAAVSDTDDRRRALRAQRRAHHLAQRVPRPHPRHSARFAASLAQTDAYTQIKDPIGSGPFKMVMREWKLGHGSLR